MSTKSLPRLLGALYWGLTVFIALHRLGVFWIPMAAGAALSCAALAWFHPRLAYFGGIACAGLGLYRLSPGLVPGFAAFIVLLEFAAAKSPSGQWTRMLAVSMPALCDLSVLSHSISIETLPLLLIPLLAAKGPAMCAALTGLVMTLLGGILKQKLVFGHFIATEIIPHNFWRTDAGTLHPGDWGWLAGAWTSEATDTLVKTPVEIAKLLLAEPQLLMMVAAWSAASFLIAAGRQARGLKSLWLILGYLAGTALLTGGYYATTRTQIFTLETYYWFTGQNLIMATVILVANGFLAAPAEAAKLKKQTVVPAPPAAPPSAADRIKQKDLNLQETLKIQAELKEYIQKEFVKKTTALDIDIAGSSAMKEGEESAKVVESFAGFWKRVDGKMLQWDGKLLNRAGDGAIFLFEDVDRAVQAARDAIKSIREFNLKGSGLKSPFKVRIGMHTGELMTDKQTSGGEVFSRVLDIAGHLQKAAGDDEIRISEETHRTLKTSRGFEPAGMLAKDNIATFAVKP